jgi:ATP-dependent DNA helicase RecQ
LIVRQDLLTKDLNLLKQVSYYATSDGCLRRAILNYFDEDAADTCGACSGCVGEFIDADITTETQKILSCVFRLGERGRKLGKSKLAKILRGSRSKWIKDEGLDTLSTYGIMSEVSEQRVQYLVDLLALRSYLSSSSGTYPVIALGEHASKVLTASPQKIMLREAVGADFDEQDSGGAMTDCDNSNNSKKQRRSRSTKERAAATKHELSDAEFGLFESLRSLRRELADEEGVPAFVIFSDATLYDMVDKLPQNSEEFLEVSGVGEVKHQRYGEAFLAIINHYVF